MGMKACAKEQFGSDSLSGKKIAVQGVGHVGEYLVKELTAENAEVFVTDIHEPTLKRVAAEYGAKVVGLDEIYDLDMDIYAPCALGATVNDETLSRLKCSIIAMDCVVNSSSVLKPNGLIILPLKRYFF
jgi:leucine dehydrogenase